MNDQSSPKERVECHLSKVLALLGLPVEVGTMSVKIVTIADKYGSLGSNNPLGETAGIVYIAGILSGHPVILAVIADNVGISSKTVRKYKTQLARELKTRKEWSGLPRKDR